MIAARPTARVACALLLPVLAGCAGPARTRLAVKAEPPKPRHQALEPGAIRHAPDNSVMVLVPAGPFVRGSGLKDAGPQRKIQLDAFYIDRYEVSCARYRGCVVAGACSLPGRQHKECTYGHIGLEGYPVSCVDWAQADAYCRWAGKRLPTEAEWEKAARGTDGRVFPWGNQRPSCQLTQYLRCDGRPFPVASFAEVASPYGAVQLAGNVWEWVADWYAGDYYANSPAHNPRGPRTGTLRIMRGGSYRSVDFFLTTTHRNRAEPGSRDRGNGFRCARDAGPDILSAP